MIKKLLIYMLPLYVILFPLLWISWGLEGILAFISAIIFLLIILKGLVIWINFVDKHIEK